MRVSANIYPEVNGKEYEIELYLQVYENLDWEIINHDEDSPFTSDEIQEYAERLLDTETVRELVAYEHQRREQEKAEHKLDMMREQGRM